MPRSHLFVGGCDENSRLVADRDFVSDRLAMARCLMRRLPAVRYPAVEVNAVSGGDRVDQGLELGEWGLVHPGLPPPVEGDAGGSQEVTVKTCGSVDLSPAGTLWMIFVK